MLAPTSSLQAGSEASVPERAMLGAAWLVSRRALLAIALLSVILSLAIAAALSRTVTDRRQALPAARPGSALHGGLTSLPLAAQAPVSAALGADARAYRIRASAGGLRTSNPAQRLQIRFDRSGPLLTSPGMEVGLALDSIGYGRAVQHLGGAEPRARANRVSYARDGVAEWYRNGPAGLEQGFTVGKAPAGSADGPLTIILRLSGNAHLALAAGGHNLVLSRPGAAALRYTGLVASDARGTALHAWMSLQGKRLTLRVDARNARFPVRIDPLIQQAKLTAPGEVGLGQFGYSAALSADGNTALIGGPEDAEQLGAAWVFTRSGSTWSQQGPKLTPTGEVGFGRFGNHVALSSDGNTALIGAPEDNNASGAAWVFTRSLSTWSQQGAKLTGGEELPEGGGRGGSFGTAVALSSDGNTALIGGSGDNGGAGAAWVFTRSGSTWAQQGAKIAGSGRFGGSVALSGEGGTALIAGGGGVGAVSVFTRSGSTWAQQGPALKGGEEIGEGEFGKGLALSADGNTALIGGPLDNKGVNLGPGAAWVFTRSGSTWTQQGPKLTASDGAGTSSFGYSVALSSDGNTALIGGPHDGAAGAAGAAWEFSRSGSIWTQQGSKITPSGQAGNGPDFGISVALSSDATTALVGGSYDINGVGSAWAFTRSGSTWSQQGPKLTASGELGQGMFGNHVALSADGNTALIGGGEDDGWVGAAWVFTRSGSTWSQQGPKLTASEEVGFARFGGKVALSSDGNTALIGGAADNESVGAAWVFTRTGSTWSQQGPKLTGGEELPEGGGIGGRFGAAVALSSDGNTALVGGYGDNGGHGAAWVFTRSGSAWAQQGPKIAGSGGLFGSNVALSGEGGTALIRGGGGVGAVSVFTRSGSTWSQQGPVLKGGEEIGEGEFGSGLALSADGNTALIGGWMDNKAAGHGYGPGAAWVFTRSGSTWTQQGPKLTASDGAGTSGFGLSVGLSSDGNTALIGGPHDGSTAIAGAAWVFSRSGSTWTQQGSKITASEEVGQEPGFGDSVALSSDATTALIGGTGDRRGIGAVWVFAASAPGVTQLEPSNGPTAGGTSVNITGTNFTGATAVRFGSNSAASFKVNSASSITAVSPAGAGTVDVTVTTPGGTSAISPADQFTYGPIVTNVEPRSGPTAGGTTVNITGVNIGAATAVRFGSNSATSFKINSSSSISAVSPAGSGTVDVTVTTPEGTAATSPADQFTYGPTVTKLEPNTGPGTGGTTVNITGTNLTGATAVTFGVLNAASFKVNSATSITAVSPGGIRIVAVRVSNPEGTSPESPADEFTYAERGSLPPTVKSVEPGAGPASGGSTVTLTGTHLQGATEVRFGSTKATSFTVNSETSITAVSPSFSSGSAIVDVTVTTPEGTSPITTNSTPLSESDLFAYAPTITGVEPSKGPAAGGTSVQLHGFGFAATFKRGAAPPCWICTIKFGSAEATKYTVNNESSITVSSPAGAGTVDVTATSGGGTSPLTPADRFVFTSAPTVETTPASSIAPTSATLNGTVNPNGEEVSQCVLEYGTTTAYGSSAPCSSLPGSGTTPIPVSAAVTGLAPSTTYHFRVSASNAIGTVKGADVTLKTLPPASTVTTTAASAVTRTLATVNGTVNPNGTTVSDCHFDYGPTTSYGSTAPCASPPGSGESAVAVVASLGNLSPATTYHFRVSATNAGGTSTGSDQTFTTLAALSTPHWYKNAMKVPLGEKSPLIGWGTLTLESSAGTATCRTAQAANVENAAGAATKEVVLFAAWECKPVGGSCTGGEQRATPRHVPWQGTMLEEGVEGSGEFREEGWGIELNLECFKGGVNTANQLFKTGPVLTETGTSTPAWLNGTSATKPSEASFDLSSGHLEAEVEKAAVKGTTKGKLKFVGYQDNSLVPLITLAKP